MEGSASGRRVNGDGCVLALPNMRVDLPEVKVSPLFLFYFILLLMICFSSPGWSCEACWSAKWKCAMMVICRTCV